MKLKLYDKGTLDQTGYIIDHERDKDGNLIKFKHKSRIFAKKIQLKNSKGSRTLKMDHQRKTLI